MTTYTYPVGGAAEPVSGMTAEQVAIERLSYDGDNYELRREGDGWQVYVTDPLKRSAPMVPAYARDRLYSAEPDEAAAWAELCERIVHADWRSVPDAMTDADYQRMLDEIAAEA